MNTEQRLETLVRAAQFDVCGYSGQNDLSTNAPHGGNSPLRYIYRAALPGGGCVSLFKVLLTSVCTNDCAYCVNQIGRDRPRATFQPEELARIFMELYRKRIARGLFLSSGVAGNPSRTMENMIKTVEILRRKYQYKDYIHLKILPGATFDCVEAACKLATRVSVNMEAPSAKRLARLSTKKNIHRDILERMQWVKRIKGDKELIVPSGQTTQFVVGAADESDRELITTTAGLYNEVGLRRVYFSAFQPISQSILSEHLPTPPMREHRLYQADWLLREYRFSLQEVEMALEKDGDFSLAKDPKVVIARKQPWLFPVDVNTASYEELLRVPGIGPTSAQRIVEARKESSITSLEHLKKMRVVTKRAQHYVWYKSMLNSEKQLSYMPQLEEEEAVPEPSLAGALG